MCEKQVECTPSISNPNTATLGLGNCKDSSFSEIGVRLLVSVWAPRGNGIDACILHHVLVSVPRPIPTRCRVCVCELQIAYVYLASGAIPHTPAGAESPCTPSETSVLQTLCAHPTPKAQTLATPLQKLYEHDHRR